MRKYIDNEDSAEEVGEMIRKVETQEQRLQRRQARQHVVDETLRIHFADYHNIIGFEGEINFQPNQRLSEFVTVSFSENKKYAVLYLLLNPEDDLAITDIYIAR